MAAKNWCPSKGAGLFFRFNPHRRGFGFVFAGCLCFMLRCKIGHDGLRSAVPTLYQRLLRWEDVAVVRGFGSPFYFIRGRAFGGGHCILPRRFLLKRPDSFRELIDQYAPADNIVRKKLI